MHFAHWADVLCKACNGFLFHSKLRKAYFCIRKQLNETYNDGTREGTGNGGSGEVLPAEGTADGAGSEIGNQRGAEADAGREGAAATGAVPEGAPAGEVSGETEARGAAQLGTEVPSTERREAEAEVSGSGAFEYFKGTLRELVELGKKAGNVLHKMVLIPSVSDRLKKDLESNGIILDAPYKHTIDNFAIKHTINEHANEEERLRGQVPVSDADFEQASDVIENYDGIEVSTNNRGQNVIIYHKAYPDGRIVYVEEIRGEETRRTCFCFYAEV